jgi:hypothetical protein
MGASSTPVPAIEHFRIREPVNVRGEAKLRVRGQVSDDRDDGVSSHDQHFLVFDTDMSMT